MKIVKLYVDKDALEKLFIIDILEHLKYDGDHQFIAF